MIPSLMIVLTAIILAGRIYKNNYLNAQQKLIDDREIEKKISILNGVDAIRIKQMFDDTQRLDKDRLSMAYLLYVALSFGAQVFALVLNTIKSSQSIIELVLRIAIPLIVAIIIVVVFSMKKHNQFASESIGIFSFDRELSDEDASMLEMRKTMELLYEKEKKNIGTINALDGALATLIAVSFIICSVLIN